MQKTIFVVDDNLVNLSVARDALTEKYRVMTMPSASKMFALMDKVVPSLILLDIEMPEMDGFEALRLLKANSASAGIPVIFLTSMNDASIEVRGFEMGVIDFIAKPFSAPVLIKRIQTHIGIDEIIRERTSQIKQLKNAIVFTFADLVESRDYETGGHVERTTEYIEILVNAMIERGVYKDEIKEIVLDSLITSARLHDVGKVAISDIILNKQGKLSDEEFNAMKTHTTKGEEIIDQMAARTSDSEFLRNAKLFAGFHHERWDGNGYPYGRKGADIPLQGRIMAIVDVYDALVSERPYKMPFTEEETIKIIMDGSGKQFDPLLADVFFEVKDKFHSVKIKYSAQKTASFN
jgi:putative two-component system response regulator